jgi:biotin-(acetyl-CoA carboxylase) ligase
MPLDIDSRVRSPFAPVLDLPPPFRAVALREVGDAFAHATKIAADAGAGTLVHVGRFDVAEFAVVLEPDEPLRMARRALYAGLTALGDALAAHAPPEKSITFDWPATIRIDGGLVGGARLGWPAGADENAPPPWLVLGAMIRTVTVNGDEPGLHPLAATLDDEGFADLGASRLLASFARHLMVTVDAWQQDGFAAVARNFLSRLASERLAPERLAPETGVQYAIDDNGDLLLRRAGTAAIERRPLAPALAAPSWLDPATGDPML